MKVRISMAGGELPTRPTASGIVFKNPGCGLVDNSPFLKREMRKSVTQIAGLNGYLNCRLHTAFFWAPREGPLSARLLRRAWTGWKPVRLRAVRKALNHSLPPAETGVREQAAEIPFFRGLLGSS